MRILFFFIFTFSLFSSFSQEDSLRVRINHHVIEADIVNPTVRVETYIEVTDSIDSFIDNIQKQFGEVENENGIFYWEKVDIDSIMNGYKIIMYHGIWTSKNNNITFKPVSISKAEKLKSNEQRGLRIRILLKDRKDALSSKANEKYFVKLFEGLLNSSEEDEEVIEE